MAFWFGGLLIEGGLLVWCFLIESHLLLVGSVVAFWFGGLLIEGGLLVWWPSGLMPSD